MKLIENPALSSKPATPGKLDEMLSPLKLGRALTPEMEAQEAVIASLEKALDNRYVMLRNVTLEGLDIPIPLVLVGPPGVTVIYPSPARGVFRAKGDVWEQMDARQELYRPSSPNLLTRTELMAQAVAAYLAEKLAAESEVEAVLFFSDPGIHVDAVRPSVRIVQVDGMDRFVAGLLQTPIYMEKEEVSKIADVFVKSMGISERETSPYPERDAFSFQEEASRDTLLDRLPRGEGVVRSLNKIPFSGRQWFLLGCMGVVDIIILVAFVILVLLTS